LSIHGQTEVLVKITVDVDCTPEEARAFLGLPDVKPMHEQLMQEMKERMASIIRSMGPEEMLSTWLTTGLAGFDQLKEVFSRVRERE
jgi:uncharacterized protein DUF6489